MRLGFVLALARFSTPEIMGQYALVVGIDSVAMALAGLEFHTFTARRYALRPVPGRLRLLIATHRRLLSYTLSAAGLIAMVAAYALGLTHDWLQLVLLGVLVSTGAATQEIARYLVLTGKPVHSIFLTFVRASTWQPLAVVLMLRHGDVFSQLLELWCLGSVAALVWGVRELRAVLTFRGRPRRALLLRGWASATGFYGVAVSSALLGNLERFTLQILLGPAAVGVFSFFQTLANSLPSLVQVGIVNLTLPALLARFGQKTADRFEYLYRQMRRAALACVLISVSILIATVPLLHALKRPEYLSRMWILPVLLFGQTLLGWTQPVHLALYAARLDRVLLIIMGGSVVGSLLLNVTLIPIFGLVGAAAAPMVGGCTVAAARLWAMNEKRRGGAM